MPIAAVLLIIVGVLEILFALLAGAGQFMQPNPSIRAVVVAGVFGLIALATILLGARGRASRGERIAIMVAHGLLASCIGIGIIALVMGMTTSAAPQQPAFAMVVVMLLVAMVLPLLAFGAAAFLPTRARASNPDPFPPTGGDVESPAGNRTLIVSAIALAAIVGVIALVGVVSIVARSCGTPPAGAAAPSSGPGETKRFEDLNFEFQLPGSPWVSIDPASINPDAAMLVRRVRPEIAMLIIAEASGDLPDLTSDGLADIAIASLQSIAPSTKVLARESHSFAGLDGRLVRSSARIDPHDLRYVHLVGASNGYFYQLITYGGVANAEAIDAAALELAGRFSLIDPERQASAGGDLIDAPLSSESFGLDLDLTGRSWIHWENIAQDLPDAEFGALRNDGAAVAVILDREPPHLDLTANAFLDMIGFDFPGPEIGSVSEFERDGLTGYRIEALRAGDEGDQYAYRLEIIQTDQFACMLACWWLNGVETARAAAIDALEAIQIAPPSAEPEGFLDALDRRQRERHATFCNSIGLEFDEQGRNADELDWFRRALRFDPENAVVFTNMVTSFEELGRIDDAARTIRENADRFAGVEDITLLDASLHARTGGTERALAKYDELFSSGYRNDEQLRNFTELLINEGDAERALAAIDDFAQAPPGADASIARADTLVALDRYDEASKVLHTAAAGPPFDPAPLRHLIGLAYDGDHYNEGIEASQELIQREVASANTWYMKGLNEMALGWHREAQTSLERAQELAPSSEAVQDELRFVASLLGEGENAAIRQSIDPVPIPVELLEAAPDAQWLAEARASHGASDDLRLRAIEFVPGERLRQTDLIRARVLESRGRDRLGSFEFDFDPLHERMFVNHLRVFDGDGNLVHDGQSSEWYVMDDDNASDEASFDQTLHVPVAALEPGRTIELMVTRERLNPPARLPFQEHAMVSVVPAVRVGVILVADPDLVIVRTPEGARSISFESGRAWVMEPAEALVAEARQPAWQQWAPVFRSVGRGADWSQLAVEYLDDIAEKLERSPQISDLSRQLTDGLSSIEDQVTALARYVQQSLDYRAIEFGRRAWLPNDADSVLHNRYGDCKDHALLLHQLLRAAEIESRLALVHTSAPLAPDLPSTDQFNHMIVSVPGLGPDRYIDVTDKHTSPVMPAPFYLGGQTVLLLDRDEPRLAQIPTYASSDYERLCDRTVEIDPEGVVLITERAEFRGFGAEAYRRALASLSRDEDSQTIASWFTSERIAVEILEVSVEHVDQTTEPLIINVRYRLARRFEAGDDRIRGEIPTLWAIHTIDEVSPATQRKTPFEIHFPLRVAVRTRVVPPPGHRVTEPAPPSLASDERFWQGTARADADGDGVRFELDCTLPAGLHAPEEWQTYVSSVRQASEAFVQRIVLVAED